MHRFIASGVPPALSPALFSNLRTFHEMRCFLCANLSQHLLLHLGTRQIRQRGAATVTALTLQEGTNCAVAHMRFSLYAQHINTQSRGRFTWSTGGREAGTEGCCRATCPECQIYQANRHNTSSLLSSLSQSEPISGQTSRFGIKSSLS